jgi:HSP20 family protein
VPGARPRQALGSTNATELVHGLLFSEASETGATIMSNIVKKDENAGGLFPSMRDLLRWDPFREMAPLWNRFERGAAEWMPSFEVRETQDSYVFKADLPGVKKEDVDVSLRGNRLQISGKRESEKENKDDTYYTYERSYGSFTRAFTLPAEIDAEHVHSELKDGVLTLAIPKKAAAQARKIPIGTGTTKS